MNRKRNFVFGGEGTWAYAKAGITGFTAFGAKTEGKRAPPMRDEPVRP